MIWRRLISRSCEPKESLVEDLMLTLMVVSLVRLARDRDREMSDRGNTSSSLDHVEQGS